METCAYEAVIVGLIQFLMQDAMHSELIYGSLKQLANHAHDSCLCFFEIALAHLKAVEPHNVLSLAQSVGRHPGHRHDPAQ